MPADKAFYERIARIESGRQWAPDGVIHTPRAGRNRGEKRVKGGSGLLLGLVLTVPLVGFVLGPDNLPEPVIGLLESPAADAALARLGQIELIAAIIDP